eukprot:6172175-Pleurochrysis_carterae.AAC.1
MADTAATRDETDLPVEQGAVAGAGAEAEQQRSRSKAKRWMLAPACIFQLYFTLPFVKQQTAPNFLQRLFLKEDCRTDYKEWADNLAVALLSSAVKVYTKTGAVCVLA